MVVLCDRLRKTGALAEDSILLDLPERLLHCLEVLAEHSALPPSGEFVRIDHGLTQQQLADRVGVSRVSINKQLNAWREEGLIEHGRGYVVLLDWRALKVSAGSDCSPRS